MEKYIVVKGVKTHNLKNIDVKIPRGKITALVGVSGAGKTSLAFDTIYAEGYMRYIESISPYIRQFLDKIQKPPVESIDGLPPAISFKHKKPAKNRRSITATSLDIYDYLRLLYAKIAEFLCPGCGKPIKRYSIDEIIPDVMESYEGKVDICFTYKGEIAFLVNRGYYFYIDPAREKRQRIDSSVKDKTIHVLIDSIDVTEENISRMFEAFDKSISFGDGNGFLFYNDKKGLKKSKRVYSNTLFCSTCNVQYPQPDENLFSFNSSRGSCRHCKGAGELQVNDEIQRCPSCSGSRLNEFSRGFKIQNKDIGQVLDLTIQEASDFMGCLEPGKYKDKISLDVFTDIASRLQFLLETGLSYIQLNRPTSTLSRGEFQRINLAFILGSNLSDSLLILDQPSADLHPHDYAKLHTFLKRLRDNDNTIIIIEHNRDIVQGCDHVLELGPLSGEKGGKLVFDNSRKEFFGTGNGTQTLTQVFFHRPVQLKQSTGEFQQWFTYGNANTYNLKGLDFQVPRYGFTVVTGVSGAGKTTLLYNEIYKKNGSRSTVFIDPGLQKFRAGTMVAGFFDLFGTVREIYAGLKESRILGYTSSHFSFNSGVGGCDQCKGKGYNEIQMQFLPAVRIVCQTCIGSGYKADILKIRYKGKSIRELLDLSAAAFAELAAVELPLRAQQSVRAIIENGMGYIRMGQPLNTLSSGELQRLKLVKHLDKQTHDTLFLIDEPAFGMHPNDIEMVKALISKIVKAKNTVVAAEHNLSLIAHADYLLELGPVGGDEGGYLVFQGFPGEISRQEKSLTGKYLKKKFKNT